MQAPTFVCEWLHLEYQLLQLFYLLTKGKTQLIKLASKMWGGPWRLSASVRRTFSAVKVTGAQP